MRTAGVIGAGVLAVMVAGAIACVGAVVEVALLVGFASVGGGVWVVGVAMAVLVVFPVLVLLAAARAGWWVFEVSDEAFGGPRTVMTGAPLRGRIARAAAAGVVATTATVVVAPALYLLPVGLNLTFCGRPTDPRGAVEVLDRGRRIECTSEAASGGGAARVLDLSRMWWSAVLLVGAAPLVGLLGATAGYRAIGPVGIGRPVGWETGPA